MFLTVYNKSLIISLQNSLDVLTSAHYVITHSNTRE